jgi:uncharacterized membrane protein
MSVAIILSLVLLGLVLLLALVLPSVTSPTVPFGVRVPAEHAGDLAVAGQARIYRWRVLVGGVVVAGVGVGIYLVTAQPSMLPLSVLALVGLWYWCFFAAHQEIRAAKAAGEWFEGLHQGIAVDTGVRTDPLRFPWPWLAPAVIITVATGVIGVLMYPSMPDVLAVHYGKGAPDRVTAKSVGTAFSLVFLQIGLTALLAVMTAAIVRSRPDIDPARPIGSVHWYRRYTALSAKALLGLVATIDLGMLGSSLLMWTGTVTPWAPLVVALPILAAVVAVVLVLARNNRDRDDDDEEDTGLTHRDDDRFWHGGLFYINREDRALLVPRRFGLGWTVNLGNPKTAILLTGVLALITLVITLRLGG